METRIIIRGRAITPLLEIDGKQITAKRDKFGNSVFEFSTPSSTCEIRIYSLKHELSEKYWWLFAFLFYLVSVFGLFNTKYPKNYYSLDYVGTLDTNQNELDLQLSLLKENEPALICRSGEFRNNQTNVYSFDSQAKKRRRLCFWLKILSWIAIIAIVVIMLLN